MNTQLAKVENESNFLTADEVVAGANLIQQVMKKVMKDGTHYGKVPGCGDKPTLLKPGAEKILSTFRIAVNPEVEDLSTADCIKYRVKAVGVSNGKEVGAGIGVCSSNEEKYKWRKAVGGEFGETPEDRRRKKWKKSTNGTYQEEQVRTSPDDLANTILKMAKKRAMVDLCLTATAASDCFAQDLEDLPAEYVDIEATPSAHAEMPQRKTAQVQIVQEDPKPDFVPPTPEEEFQETQQPQVSDDFKPMKAKYPGVCKGCQKPMAVGSDILYSKTQGAFHKDCVK